MGKDKSVGRLDKEFLPNREGVPPLESEAAQAEIERLRVLLGGLSSSQLDSMIQLLDDEVTT